MKEGLYLRNKDEVFIDCGLKPKQKGYNCHHELFRNDLKTHKLHPDFPINDKANLIPLPIPVHEELHKLVDSNPLFKNDISLRVYFSNMAYIGELDLVPQRGYQTFPEDICLR